MRISKIGLVLCVLALTGAGCLGGGTKSTGTDGGVFKTVNGGTSFTQQNVITSARGTGSIAGVDIVTLEMDPEDNRTIYAGTRANGLIYSIDSGSSWQQARESALREGSIAAVETDPNDVCTVYIAKGQRLYKSDDCLRSFNANAYVETRSSVAVAQIAVDWYDSNIVWLGLSNGDVLKSEDGAATWRKSVATKESITALLVNNADSRVVLVGTAGEGFFKTTDSGATWTQVKDELKQLRNAAKVSALSQTKDGGTLLAATSYGILRSTDFGSTWKAIQLLTSAGQVSIRAVAIDPNTPDVITYAANSTFYRSTDAGVKWTTSKLATTRAPMVLLPDPTSAETLYLGVATIEK